MRPFLLATLIGALLAACAVPDASETAARNLQSTQPDRSGDK